MWWSPGTDARSSSANRVECSYVEGAAGRYSLVRPPGRTRSKEMKLAPADPSPLPLHRNSAVISVIAVIVGFLGMWTMVLAAGRNGGPGSGVMACTSLIGSEI